MKAEIGGCVLAGLGGVGAQELLLVMACIIPLYKITSRIFVSDYLPCASILRKKQLRTGPSVTVLISDDGKWSM